MMDEAKARFEGFVGEKMNEAKARLEDAAIEMVETQAQEAKNHVD